MEETIFSSMLLKAYKYRQFEWFYGRWKIFSKIFFGFRFFLYLCNLKPINIKYDRHHSAESDSYQHS